MVEISGEFDKDSLNTVTEETVKELRNLNWTKVLFDHREATLHLTTLQLYEKPLIDISLGLSRRDSIAVLYSKSEEDFQFLETVASNNGLNLKVFKNLKKAIIWLQKN